MDIYIVQEYTYSDIYCQFIDAPKKEGSSTARDKFLNNAINTEGEDFGLFPTIAMINHSCSPNAGIC